MNDSLQSGIGALQSAELLILERQNLRTHEVLLRDDNGRRRHLNDDDESSDGGGE